MKKLILILSLLSQLYLNAQKKIEVYVPLRTYHFERNQATMNDYYKTEGGDLGLILKVDNISVGGFRNSYGDLSFTAQYGINIKTIKNVSTSLNLGITSGYEKFYQNADIANKFPKELRSNGLLPTVLFSMSYSKYRLQPTLIVSPTFINSGLTYRIK